MNAFLHVSLHIKANCSIVELHGYPKNTKCKAGAEDLLHIYSTVLVYLYQ